MKWYLFPLVVVIFAALAYSALSADMDCAMRAGSCSAGETPLLYVGNMSAGYGNAHSQLLNYTSNYPEWCYQENADLASSCGGVVGGGYTDEGGKWVNDAYMHDGSWTRGGSPPIGTNIQANLTITYIKPKHAAATSLWQIKSNYLASDPAPDANVSIPSSCWNRDPDSITLRVSGWSYGSSGSFPSTFAGNGTEWSCWDGTLWEVLNTTAVNYTGAMEEAMWWKISPSTYTQVLCCNSTINPVSNYSNGTAFLRLSGYGNAHSQDPSTTGLTTIYPYIAYISTPAPQPTCTYTAGSCQTNTTCMVTMSARTNAHIGSCAQSPGWCYQETANISTSCGGLSTGIYYTPNPLTNPGGGGQYWSSTYKYSNTHDGNWSSAGFYGIGPVEYYVNYTAPVGISTSASTMQIRLGANSGANCLVPNDAFNVSIAPKYVINGILSCEIQLNGDSPFTRLMCYNGTEYEQIGASLGDNPCLYEEAIFWNVVNAPSYPNSICCGTGTIVSNASLVWSTIPDKVYTYNPTADTTAQLYIADLGAYISQNTTAPTFTASSPSASALCFVNNNGLYLQNQAGGDTSSTCTVGATQPGYVVANTSFQFSWVFSGGGGGGPGGGGGGGTPSTQTNTTLSPLPPGSVTCAWNYNKALYSLGDNIELTTICPIGNNSYTYLLEWRDVNNTLLKSEAGIMNTSAIIRYYLPDKIQDGTATFTLGGTKMFSAPFVMSKVSLGTLYMVLLAIGVGLVFFAIIWLAEKAIAYFKKEEKKRRRQEQDGIY